MIRRNRHRISLGTLGWILQAQMRGEFLAHKMVGPSCQETRIKKWDLVELDVFSCRGCTFPAELVPVKFSDHRHEVGEVVSPRQSQSAVFNEEPQLSADYPGEMRRFC